MGICLILVLGGKDSSKGTVKTRYTSEAGGGFDERYAAFSSSWFGNTNRGVVGTRIRRELPVMQQCKNA